MKKCQKLEDILSTDIQLKNDNALKNVKLLNDEQNSTVKEIKQDINNNESNIQSSIKPQTIQEGFDKQLTNLIIDYEQSLDEFIKNQNYELIQEDEGINIQYIEKLLDFFDQLAGRDKRFMKVFEKIQVSVGLMVHKAIEQIIELRQIVMDLSKQVDSYDEIKLQKIQLEAKYEKEKQQSQKFEKYKEYLEKFISPNENSLDTFKIIEENQKLRTLLIKQKKNVCEMMEKEQKVMKLLYAIRQSGVDIESIYKECITPEASTGNNSKNASKKVESYENNLQLEKELINTTNMNKNQFKKQKEDNKIEVIQIEKESMDSESEEAEFLFYQYEDCNKDKQQAHANQQMKLNLQTVQTHNQQGFHEEFMANINEWSESWRLAAGKEKKF